jgi:hypothetical protein
VETEIGPGEASPGADGGAMAGLPPDFAAPVAEAVRRAAVVARRRGRLQGGGEVVGRRIFGRRWPERYRRR